MESVVETNIEIIRTMAPFDADTLTVLRFTCLLLMSEQINFPLEVAINSGSDVADFIVIMYVEGWNNNYLE